MRVEPPPGSVTVLAFKDRTLFHPRLEPGTCSVKYVKHADCFHSPARKLLTKRPPLRDDEAKLHPQHHVSETVWNTGASEMRSKGLQSLLQAGESVVSLDVVPMDKDLVLGNLTVVESVTSRHGLVFRMQSKLPRARPPWQLKEQGHLSPKAFQTWTSLLVHLDVPKTSPFIEIDDLIRRPNGCACNIISTFTR